MRQLFLIPHSDDELLLYGLLLQLADRAETVSVVLSGLRDSERAKESKAFFGHLGLEEPVFLGYPDLWSVDPEAAMQCGNEIYRMIREDAYSRIYVPALEGGHADHDYTAIVVTAIVSKSPGTSEVIEVPGYHLYGMRRRTGCFVRKSRFPAERISEPQDAEPYHALSAFFPSQHSILNKFPDYARCFRRMECPVDINSVGNNMTYAELFLKQKHEESICNALGVAQALGGMKQAAGQGMRSQDRQGRKRTINMAAVLNDCRPDVRPRCDCGEQAIVDRAFEANGRRCIMCHNSRSEYEIWYSHEDYGVADLYATECHGREHGIKGFELIGSNKMFTTYVVERVKSTSMAAIIDTGMEWKAYMPGIVEAISAMHRNVYRSGMPACNVRVSHWPNSMVADSSLLEDGLRTLAQRAAEQLRGVVLDPFVTISASRWKEVMRTQHKIEMRLCYGALSWNRIAIASEGHAIHLSYLNGLDYSDPAHDLACLSLSRLSFPHRTSVFKEFMEHYCAASEWVDEAFLARLLAYQPIVAIKRLVAICRRRDARTHLRIDEYCQGLLDVASGREDR